MASGEGEDGYSLSKKSKNVHSARGTAQPSRHGKFLIAKSTHEKGKAFIGASILLKRQSQSEASQYVALHLLSQGTELILKSLLLIVDYDKFNPRLKHFGHDLLKLTRTVEQTFSVDKLPSRTADELVELNKFYAKHFFRYGSALDILINPATVPHRFLLRRVGAVIRITERYLRTSGN